ncbi:Hypothetical protein, putative [Bodo saltans]|uniref:Uncharacterized protein n=1 Tax=Bodo saltans TaxID=75058 RepID=A0A0S4JLS1_BODSA|nr:Hypothetical protein, putative [Bodo saltans]|eukprot:CUG92469.1 Hypothetical protein, putative [Bodo saltans]
MSLSVPDSAKDCQNCAECVIFVLAKQEADRQAKSAGKAPQHRGTTKAQLTRTLTSEFSSFAEEPLWHEVIDALCKSGVIINLNADVAKSVRSFMVQPMYALSSSIKRSEETPVDKAPKVLTKAQKRRLSYARSAKKGAAGAPKKRGK